MNKRKTIIKITPSLIVILILFLFPGIIYAESSYWEEVGSYGNINWTKSFITVAGSAYAPQDVANKTEARLIAQKAAQRNAYANLAEIANRMYLSSGEKVRNVVYKGASVKIEFRDFIRNAPVAYIKYSPDGKVEIAMQASINGINGLTNILYPYLLPSDTDENTDEMSITSLFTQPAEVKDTLRIEEKLDLTGEIIKTETFHTGIIIDARGLDLKPAICPAIMTEDKEEFHSINTINPLHLEQIGLVIYLTDIEEAKNNKRVGQNPYIVKGIKSSGKKKIDIVIKKADITEFQKNKRDQEILKRCKVIIVLD